MTDIPPSDDTIKSVEGFLEGFAQPGVAPDNKAAMRSFGQSVGYFILGILDTGVGVHVALQQAGILIHVVASRPRQE